MTIIDVRSKGEFKQEHVKGALWLDVERIAAGETPDVPKDEQIILYCRSGARSSVAAHMLQAKGFAKAVSGGGLSTMAMAGHKIVR
jgi:phage shock protein E